MESWYDQLLNRDDREAVLLEDYAPYAAELRQLTGRIVDIGGGAGVSARFLDPAVDLVVVEPAASWQTPEWVAFGEEFRGSGPVPQFVHAPGEALPFADGEFDAALSFWTLNHVADVGRCVDETARVLRPGGVAFLVIDDIEPSWFDLVREALPRVVARLRNGTYEARILKPLRDALREKWRGDWRIQPDHLRIEESRLLEMLAKHFRLERRQWVAGSLKYRLTRA